MYCRNCGKEHSETAKYCGNCGVLIQRTETRSNAPPQELNLPTLFESNAYHILGLDTTSDPREIQKRGNEIINHLKIDDLPEYDLDIDNPKKFRNKQSVKESLQKMASPKSSVIELFFWFEADNSDKKNEIVASIKSVFSPNGFKSLSQNTAFTGDTDGFDKKNLAIFYSIILFNKNFKPYLITSLNLWKYLINSEKFWTLFIESYKTRFEIDIESDVINDIKKVVLSNLSDLYVELGQKNSDPAYYLEFQKNFSFKGEKLENDVLNPAFQNIHNSIEELNLIKISKDFPLDLLAQEQIDRSIQKIDAELHTMNSFGLYEESQVKIVRDRAAEAIREISVKINNEWDNQIRAMELLKIARDISGTSALQNKLDEDIRQLEELKLNNHILKPINKFIEKEEYDRAFELIEFEEKRSSNQNLLMLLNDRKKTCVSEMIFQKYNSAMSNFKINNYYESRLIFEEITLLINKNLGLYNFNKETINNLLNDIPGQINYSLSTKSLENLQKFRENIVNAAKQNFEGQYEKDILIILVDSNVYPTLIKSGVYS